MNASAPAPAAETIADTASTIAAATTAPSSSSPPSPPPFPARPKPRADRFATSDDIERDFPHVVPIIRRSPWMVYEHSEANEALGRIGEYRRGEFNSTCTFRFAEAEHAAAFSDYAFERRLHRLRVNSTQGAAREDVALEWERIDAEREEILTWGRTTGMLREVVQHYRFERHVGAWSYTAHLAAGALVEKKHPTVPDPVNRAGVMIVWAEKEHRAWFWRGCRGTPHL